LIIHADDEIKRMGEFVDKYTQEVQLTKKQMEEEFEQRILKERQANDELKAKLHKEQQDIDLKLDKVQREIELIRQENLSLKQEKAQVNDK
jgi:septin family protein